MTTVTPDKLPSDVRPLVKVRCDECRANTIQTLVAVHLGGKAGDFIDATCNRCDEASQSEVPNRTDDADTMAVINAAWRIHDGPKPRQQTIEQASRAADYWPETADGGVDP